MLFAVVDPEGKLGMSGVSLLLSGISGLSFDCLFSPTSPLLF